MIARIDPALRLLPPSSRCDGQVRSRVEIAPSLPALRWLPPRAVMVRLSPVLFGAAFGGCVLELRWEIAKIAPLDPRPSPHNPRPSTLPDISSISTISTISIISTMPTAQRVCTESLHGKFARRVCTESVHGGFARRVCTPHFASWSRESGKRRAHFLHPVAPLTFRLNLE